MPGYPFSAIVGQPALREALLVNAVSPEVGGVLVRGERGTAKSTAVRALAPLLPAVPAAAGQPFCFAPGDLAPDGVVDGRAPCEERPAPLVELPVGATIDRLVGALDLGRALAGERAFEAGLLARAHRGVLYVDEVNLLPDHLVDVLLDAAAMGVCHVERDAVSVRHDARFLLVGTMNAEEGELRPQLLDRFGLGVEVTAPVQPSERAEIVRRRLAYEADPVGFAERFAADDADVAALIEAARERLPSVRLPERELDRIVRACAEIGVDGMRGDVVTARTARVLAALDGVDAVDAEHVRRAAHLALVHRRRRDPLGAGAADPGDIDRALQGEDDDGPADPDEPPPPPRGGGAPPPPPGPSAGDGAPPPAAADQPRPEAPDLAAPAPRDRLDAPAPAGAPDLAPLLQRGRAARSGRSARAHGAAAAPIDSRRVTGRHDAGSDDLALVATLRERLATGDAAARRVNVRAGREGVLLCLVVDASGSMAARRRMARVKGALLGLLRDAYARRDRVAIVAFRDARAHVVHLPGAPLEHAAAAVLALRTGGRTPLAAGLDAATELIRRDRARDPNARAIAVVLTDGRAPEAGGAAARLGGTADAVHVVDTEEGPVRLGLARALATAAGGSVIALPGRAITLAEKESRMTESDPLAKHGGDDVDVPHRPGDIGSAEPKRRKRRDRPLLIVITGHGKGKSTAAFGMLLRSWARGYTCGVFQFVKSGKWKVGEAKAAAALGGIDWEKMGDGWSWLSKDLDESADLARAGWAEVKRLIAEQRYEFLILDEITYPLKWGWIDTEEFVATLRDRPGFQHIVVTGRDAPAELIAVADLVSEVTKVKHPMDEGIRAQQGIEW